ncbi:MAG: tetratricopeptide repeat protein, partial [Rhodobacteraceae bacterium]|nr:tetratricopeptide repeat protein [Paracoccaceae bacterium]
MWEVIVAFLADNAVVLGGAAAATAIVETVFKPFRSIAARFKKNETVDLSPETLNVLNPERPADGPKLTIADFIRIRKELKAELMDELSTADSEGQTQLRARIADLESQIANPDKALKEAQARIVDLEARLDRDGNQVGGDKLEAARAALHAGDTSLADDLFAEIEAREALAVESVARAAFARGEIAEGEVRWADAAGHYARAAGLQQDLGNLFKAREFAHRSGDYPAAFRFGEQALEMARKGDDQQVLAKALNDHAALLKATGRYDEAEPLQREDMAITAATLGKDHPDYATSLNNLAVFYANQKLFDQALPLMEQAL